MKGLRIFASRIGLFLILLLAALFSVVLADAKAPAPTPAADPVEHLLLVPQAAE